MTRNNYERFKIMQSLPEPFDYKAFVEICENMGVELLSMSEYGQKVGMYMVGKFSFPDLSPEEQYLSVIKTQGEPGSFVANGVKKKCGGCGGGSVR